MKNENYVYSADHQLNYLTNKINQIDDSLKKMHDLETEERLKLKLEKNTLMHIIIVVYSYNKAIGNL